MGHNSNMSGSGFLATFDEEQITCTCVLKCATLDPANFSNPRAEQMDSNELFIYL